jgi:hypothetical protein
MLQKCNINFWCVLRNSNYGNTVCQDQESWTSDMKEWHFEEQHFWYNDTVHMGNFLGTMEMNGTCGKVMHVGNNGQMFHCTSIYFLLTFLASACLLKESMKWEFQSFHTLVLVVGQRHSQFGYFHKTNKLQATFLTVF